MAASVGLLRGVVEEREKRVEKIAQDLEAKRKQADEETRKARASIRVNEIFTELLEDGFGEFREDLERVASSAVEDAFGAGYLVKFVASGTTGYRLEITTPGGLTDDVDQSQGDGLSSIVSASLLLACVSLSSRYPAGFLCLDEPFAGVDKRRDGLYEWLSEVVESLGLQVILTTHHPEAMQCSNVIEVGGGENG